MIPEPAGLVQMLEQQWQQGRQPDPFAFLEAVGGAAGDSSHQLAPEVVAAVLAVDQWRRWDCGQRVLAEDYLRRCPALAEDPDAALEVIYGEFLIRQELGEQPTQAEYLQRFPSLAGLLSKQFQVCLDPDGQTNNADAPGPPTLPDREARFAGDNGVSLPDTGSTAGSGMLAELGRLGLLDPVQLKELTQRFQPLLAPKELGRELLKRDWLTAYQINQLLNGKGRELLIGGYVVLARLGGGGMGQVFKARQRSLARIVALKVIRADRLGNPDTVRRFLREVRAASRLNHPNIVQALDAGQDGAIYFLVMEHVEGSDLSKLVSKQGRLPVPSACEIIRQAAVGLQHAHEQGLIHRDIKPSNLILVRSEADGGFPVVKVLDLGLALQQQLTEEVSSVLTKAGAVLGTPDFVAPEQITDAHNAGPAADLYSLGCTLYFLLAGRPPFVGNTLALKLVQHQLNEPEPLKSLNADVPLSVARLVGKLMAKKPQERFSSAGELANILGRILKTETWKPVQPFESLQGDDEAIVRPLYEWGRKRGPSRRLLLAGSGLILVSGGGLALWLNRPRRQEPNTDPLERRASLDSLRRDAIPLQERFVWQPNELVQVLGEHRGRAWGPVGCLAVSPDGTLLASGGFERFVRIWDARTLLELRALPHPGRVHVLAFVEGGKVLLTSTEAAGGRVMRWNVETGAPIGEPTNRACGTCFSPNGKLLFDAAALLMQDAGTGRDLWQEKEKGKEGRTYAAAFTPDGRAIFHVCPDDKVRLRQAEAGQVEEIQRFAVPGGVATSLACTTREERTWLLSGGVDGVVRLWDVRTGREQAQCKVQAGVGSLTISPRRDLVLAMSGPGWNSALLELDLDTPSLKVKAFGARDALTGGVFSTTGAGLFTVDNSGWVRPWTIPASAKPPQPPSGDLALSAVSHPYLGCVALSPDGLRTFSGGIGGVRGQLWDTLTGARLAEIGDREPYQVVCALFSADGERLFVGGFSGKVHIFDGRTLEWQRTLPAEPSLIVFVLALSPDGATLAAGGGFTGSGRTDLHNWVVRLWDLETDSPPKEFLGHTNTVHGLAFTPDGRRLLSCARRSDSSLWLWDVKEKQGRKLFESKLTDLNSVAVSPDGRYVAVGANSGIVYLWDLHNDSKTPRRLPIQSAEFIKVLFAPTGERFYSASSDGTVRVSTLSGEVIGEWRLPGAVRSLALTRDGKHLATANANGTVYLLRLPAPLPSKKTGPP